MRRELREELAVEVGAATRLMTVVEPRDGFNLHLQAWRTLACRGTPQVREHQAVDWVKPEDFPIARMPPADLPIARALQLPRQYLITPDARALSAADLRAGIQRALARGIRMIRLRCADIDARLSAQMLRDCEQLITDVGGRLLVDLADYPHCRHAGTGVHLRSSQIAQFCRRAIPDASLLIASCHNVEQLIAAEFAGCDAAVVSPVAATSSHPDATTLGWDGFGRLHDRSNLPFYALGGMTAGDLGPAIRHGAIGIAAIRALWQ